MLSAGFVGKRFYSRKSHWNRLKGFTHYTNYILSNYRVLSIRETAFILIGSDGIISDNIPLTKGNTALIMILIKIQVKKALPITKCVAVLLCNYAFPNIDKE